MPCPRLESPSTCSDPGASCSPSGLRANETPRRGGVWTAPPGEKSLRTRSKPRKLASSVFHDCLSVLAGEHDRLLLQTRDLGLENKALRLKIAVSGPPSVTALQKLPSITTKVDGSCAGSTCCDSSRPSTPRRETPQTRGGAAGKLADADPLVEENKFLRSDLVKLRQSILDLERQLQACRATEEPSLWEETSRSPRESQGDPAPPAPVSRENSSRLPSHRGPTLPVPVLQASRCVSAPPCEASSLRQRFAEAGRSSMPVCATARMIGECDWTTPECLRKLFHEIDTEGCGKITTLQLHDALVNRVGIPLTNRVASFQTVRFVSIARIEAVVAAMMWQRRLDKTVQGFDLDTRSASGSISLCDFIHLLSAKQLEMAVGPELAEVVRDIRLTFSRRPDVDLRDAARAEQSFSSCAGCSSKAFLVPSCVLSAEVEPTFPKSGISSRHRMRVSDDYFVELIRRFQIDPSQRPTSPLRTNAGNGTRVQPPACVRYSSARSREHAYAL